MAKRKKSNLQWIKETLELSPDHHWEGPDDYKIFVAVGLLCLTILLIDQNEYFLIHYAHE